MVYRVMLGEYGYGYIQFYRWALALRKINVREVECVECGHRFEQGRCVYKSQYNGNGYVCLPCARRLIEKYGPLGYKENILCNLQACHEMQGVWTAQEVIEALCQREAEPTLP
jgi:hypothetical protein